MKEEGKIQRGVNMRKTRRGGKIRTKTTTFGNFYQFGQGRVGVIQRIAAVRFNLSLYLDAQPGCTSKFQPAAIIQTPLFAADVDRHIRPILPAARLTPSARFALISPCQARCDMLIGGCERISLRGSISLLAKSVYAAPKLGQANLYCISASHLRAGPVAYEPQSQKVSERTYRGVTDNRRNGQECKEIISTILSLFTLINFSLSMTPFACVRP